MKRKIILLVFLATTFNSSAQNLLIIHAKIQGMPKQDAIVVSNGKIIEIGNSSNSGIIRLSHKYPVADLKYSATIYPGFIDAHCHFTGYALDAYKCNLVGIKSEAAMLQRVKEYADTTPMRYIYGRGWDQNDWDIKEFPTKDILDKLFPDRVVILKRIDGHAILVNQFALDKSGINEGTNIDGGQIIKKNGLLTGVLMDNAMTAVENLIPQLSAKQSHSYLISMEQECTKAGLTYVVDCGLPAHDIELLRKMYKGNLLRIGMTALLSSDSRTLYNYIIKGPFREGALSVSGIKVYADGALGSRGACLLQPYSDEQGNYGTMLATNAQMDLIAADARTYGWQLCTHAIGDSANRTVLQIYHGILGTSKDKRWRIEHAQVVNPADYHYFSANGIVPSVQPTHAVSDMPWAEQRLGTARIHQAYSYKALLQEAGYIALGTDFPVEAINPLATFYTAVVRKDSMGNPKEGFNPEGKLSRKEALDGMTIWAAKSVFQEARKGSIEIGKDADFTILDTDLMTCMESDILKSKVLYTIIRGKIVYKQTK